jgi:hypothetical protein
MVSQGSPFWQAAMFILAALFLLWELWAGWRRGIVRAAVHFFAFVLSGTIGFLAGQVVAKLIEKVFPGYGLFAGLLVGSFLTLIILALALILGAVLFKRTAQQPSNTLRLLFGAGGAFFGLLTGLFILWGGLSIVRTFGTIAESSAKTQPGATAPALNRSLVTLKDSLELGPVGRVLESVDIIPPQTYDLIQRVGKLTSDQDAMMRLLDYPGMQEILQNPRMATLVSDPEVAEAASRRDIFTLMRNKKLLDAATDPELSKLLLSLDLQKALDYALPPEQASPTPNPKP